MTQRRPGLIAAILLGAFCATAPAAFGQEIITTPIRLEVGGTPGGGTWLTGGDDNTEVNFNLYTFSFYADYYLTQKVAVEGKYITGLGWGQDLFFRNGLIPSQQAPLTGDLVASVMVFPKGTGAKLPFYIAGGAGTMTLHSRETTRKLGYDPAVLSGKTFTQSNFGVGIKLPRGKAAPNWSFRLDYRMLFINSNSDAPAFFAKTKSRRGQHMEFGLQYAFRK